MTWPPHGNWEGGCTDSQGRRWLHVPHQGWALREPLPYLPVTATREQALRALRWWLIRRLIGHGAIIVACVAVMVWIWS